MNSLAQRRIESLDLLKGLVMIIMALDHTRDYFHSSAFLFNPTDPEQTTLPIFFTRWITHFCAPAFSFLAGISAFLYGRSKTKRQLSHFLLTRGLWLVFIELTFVNFAWYFDVTFRTPTLVVIWALGISMIVLAALIHLPRMSILLFSCLLIFCHNLLDGLHCQGNIFWSILHEFGFFPYANGFHIMIGYPLIPWVAVMSLGYYFGYFYDKTYPDVKRRRLLNIIGIAALVLFVILRWSNVYGNPSPWKEYDSLTKNFISFMNPNKYPPSLLYLLMTLGATLIFLANTEWLRGRLVNFFCTFGRVPFFYYILHLYLIHLIAMLFAQLTGFGWNSMILPGWITQVPELRGYGFGLRMVYVVWFLVIAILYPLCKKFDEYKMNNKEKWWLSYL